MTIIMYCCNPICFIASDVLLASPSNIIYLLNTFVLIFVVQIKQLHAGQQLSYMEVVGEPISLLDNIANNMPNSLIYNQTVAELTARGLGVNLQQLDNILQTDEVDLLLELIRTTINSDSRVWDLWIAHCPLVSITCRE